MKKVALWVIASAMVIGIVWGTVTLIDNDATPISAAPAATEQQQSSPFASPFAEVDAAAKLNPLDINSPTGRALLHKCEKLPDQWHLTYRCVIVEAQMCMVLRSRGEENTARALAEIDCR